jgi:NADPH:quinone reductase-like Zn-dependent oxidoreductase
MKAVVYDRYGPPEVLRVDDVERPVPKDDEILVRVRASTVSQSDTHIRRPNPQFWRLLFGFRRPRWRSLGVEFAGDVEAVGAAVTEFKVGDAVFGHPSTWIGTMLNTYASDTARPLRSNPPTCATRRRRPFATEPPRRSRRCARPVPRKVGGSWSTERPAR